VLEQRLHISVRILIIFLFAAFFNFCGFLTWVYLKPRSVPYLARQIEAAFEAAGSGYSIQVGNTMLRWDGWRETVGIHLFNIKLINGNQEQIASFPEAKVSIKLARLLIGDLTLRNAKLVSPSIRIHVAPGQGQQQDRPDPMKAYADMQQVIAKTVQTLAETLQSLPVDGLGFEHAKIVIDNGEQENVWEIPKAFIEVAGIHDGVEVLANIQLDFWGNTVSLDAEGELHEDKESVLRFKLKDLLAEMMADFFPSEGWIRRLGSNLSGEIDIYADGTQGLTHSNFDLVMDSDVMKFHAKGGHQNHAGYKGYAAVPEITASVDLANLPYDELKRFWPPVLGVDAREWMMAHISGGMVKSAVATAHLKPDDFLTPLISKDAVDATVTFEGIHLDYQENLPPVEQVSGVAKFDGNSMDLTANGGVMPHSKVISSEVRIFNIGRGDEEMEIDGVAKGSVEDLLTFLALKNGEKKNLKMAQMTGTHETDYHFKFPLLKDLLLSQITFFATSKMKDITIPDVRPGIAMTGGVFNVSVDNTSLSAGGEAKLGDLPAKISYYEEDGPKAEFDSRVDVLTEAEGAKLVSLGIPVKEYITGGLVKAKLRLDQKDGLASASIVSDLTDAELNIPEAGWDKPKGVKAAIIIEGQEKKPGLMQLPKISVIGDYLSIKGSGTFNTDGSTLTALKLNEAKFGRNDFTLTLTTPQANKYNILLMGKNLNLGPFIAYYKKKESADRTFAYNLETRLDQVELMNDKTIHQVKGYVDCDVERCLGTSLSARWEADRGQLLLDYKKEGVVKVFSLKVDNAGDFLSGLDFIDDIKGGEMETTAWTNATDKKPPSRGKFVMKDFKVTHAPVLAKLLTVGSLSGIADLLSGQGISFTKADSEYTYDGKVLGIQGFKAAGNSLGLTADGEVNIDTGQMLVRGNVIPAFTVNRVLGNVPMLGTILTGGEGQGVLATRYKIAGNFSDPDIQVNPLSMLTPGLLRNIWGIPEDTKLDDAPANENAPVAPAAQKPAPKKEPKTKKKVGARP
jgi:hypothetical protein